MTNRTPILMTNETLEFIRIVAEEKGISSQMAIAAAIRLYAEQSEIELKIPGLELECTDTHLIIRFRGKEISVPNNEVATLVQTLKEARPPKAGNEWLDLARNLNEISVMRDGQGIKIQRGDTKLPLALDIANSLAQKIEGFSAARLNDALAGVSGHK